MSKKLYCVGKITKNETIIKVAENPSGGLIQSNEDVSITKHLYECGKILGIDLLDHIIVGDQKFVSLKEKGVI